MEFEYYLSLARGFEPFLAIFGSESLLVRWFHPLLLLLIRTVEVLPFFFLFFSDMNLAIALVARCLRRRARVRIAGVQVRWWRFNLNLWELRVIPSNLCEFCCGLSLWVEFGNEFEESVWIWCELVLELLWIELGFHGCSWSFLWICDFDL